MFHSKGGWTSSEWICWTLHQNRDRGPKPKNKALASWVPFKLLSRQENHRASWYEYLAKLELCPNAPANVRREARRLINVDHVKGGKSKRLNCHMHNRQVSSTLPARQLSTVRLELISEPCGISMLCHMSHAQTNIPSSQYWEWGTYNGLRNSVGNFLSLRQLPTRDWSDLSSTFWAKWGPLKAPYTPVVRCG